MQPDSSSEHVRFWCAGAALQQAAQDAVVVNEHESCSAVDDVLERRDEKEDSQHLEEVDLRVLPVQELVEDGWWGIKVCVVPTAPCVHHNAQARVLATCVCPCPYCVPRGVAHWQADRRLELQKLGPPRGSVEQGRGHVKSMQWRVRLGREGFHESSSLPACRNRAGECQATSILCCLVWAALLLFCHAPQLCCPSLRLVRIHRC